MPSAHAVSLAWLALVTLACLSLAACAAEHPAGVEPSAPSLAKGGTTPTTRPYTVSFSGDIAGEIRGVMLNPSDPLALANIDTGDDLADNGDSAPLMLPVSTQPLSGTGCTVSTLDPTNTWGDYGGIEELNAPSTWKGKLELKRFTGKSIRLYFGIYAPSMCSSDTQGRFDQGSSEEAVLEFTATPGTETKTSNYNGTGAVRSTAEFKNVVAYVTGPAKSFDGNERCVTFTVVATPE